MTALPQHFATSMLTWKRASSVLGVYEMPWAPDGRATFEYGESEGEGAHVIWRRIGSHAVFRRP